MVRQMMSEKRTTIEVIGAKQNNLRNVDVEIPRDKLTVVTGVSGSGKSSLAFEVIYGEAQRRFLKSVSNYAKNRMAQMKKPRVDFVRGLSPVIAIEQKKGNNNPRSTVGTVTDTNDYLRLLFATAGVASCPVCGKVLKPVSAAKITERLMSLPQGSEVTMYSRVSKIYGEDYEFLFTRIREKGFRHLLVNGEMYDLAEKPFELDERQDYSIEILLDRIIVKREITLQVAKAVETAIAAIEDDVLVRFVLPEGTSLSIGCPEHHYVYGEREPIHFSFNHFPSSCATCQGIGSAYTAEPRFMVLNEKKSINEGALHPTLFNFRARNSYRTVILYSLSVQYGFSLDTPFCELPEEVKDLLFYGSKGEPVTMLQPPFMERRNWMAGRVMPFRGFVNEFESWYRNYLHKTGNSDAYEPNFVKDTMVERVCPECHGSRLKASRLAVKIGGKSIHELSCMDIPELASFLGDVVIEEDKREVSESIVRELLSRLTLLNDIGLHYLCLSRRSDSISGGEMQRIKMSTQISSELMGMLYVIDEPSIGLHQRDSDKVIEIMKKLRDLGNTVLVVEHDLNTMKNADYLIEVGPGAGTYGGTITAKGTPAEFLQSGCLTATYLTGERCIDTIRPRRKTIRTAIEIDGVAKGVPGGNGAKCEDGEKCVPGGNGVKCEDGEKCVPDGKGGKGADGQTKWISIRGASENNLRDVDVDIPLGRFVCVTGVSGSGKSTLIFETLAKHLEVQKRGARIVPGKARSVSGTNAISNAIIIDQSPIGRNSKSNPATYVGIYDRIRNLFASVEEAVERGYTALDFSLTHPNGVRCEHCFGDGVLVTNLQFMADIETICPVCRGERFSREGMDIRYHEKNIAEVLAMSVEEALAFFIDEPLITRKLSIMQELGLGYLTLGQTATTLSGGEAQRVKLAYELSKLKRGNHNLYIMDEPTTGLHCSDIEKLLVSIERLVEQGHSVIVVEHNMDVIKCADWVIDMGPEGGKGGGLVIAEGTPEEVARIPSSFTGHYLKEVLAIPKELC